MILDKEEDNLDRTLVWIRKQRRNSFDIGKSHIFSLSPSLKERKRNVRFAGTRKKRKPVTTLSLT